MDEVIDRLLGEQPIGVSAAAKLFGSFRQGRTTAPATVVRWCFSGVVTSDGRKIRLEHFRIGKRVMTTAAACKRFILAQQMAGDVQDLPPRSPAQRERASANAAKELSALGV
jgi:hypothetical protein